MRREEGTRRFRTENFRCSEPLWAAGVRTTPESKKVAMAPWGSKNETIVQALVMAGCCLASGSAFGVGVRTAGLRTSPARVVRTRGSAPWTGCRRPGQARAGVFDCMSLVCGAVHEAIVLRICERIYAVAVAYRPYGNMNYCCMLWGRLHSGRRVRACVGAPAPQARRV